MLKDEGKDEQIDLKQLETRLTCFPVSMSFQLFCCSLPSKSNVMGKEVQQREMLTSFHRTLDDAWWLRAKSTVEKYVVVQVMELHDESEEESREPRLGVQRCVNNGKLRGAHSRRGNEDRPEHFKFAHHWGKLGAHVVHM